MVTASTGTARGKSLTFKRDTNLSLWIVAYFAVTAILTATGNIPVDRQEQFVATLNGEAAKPLDLTIKPAGRIYLVTDGKYEMFLVPQGSVPADKSQKLIGALRENVKAAHAGS
jgi:biopolymer transport protein ExbD